MDVNTAFIKAAQLKLRFSFKGQCTVEDLFDLSREDLDALYQRHAAAAKQNEGEGLIQRRKEDRQSELCKLSMVIIKAVFDIKSEEERNVRKAADKKKRNERILEIMARKQDAELEGKTLEELESLLDD